MTEEHNQSHFFQFERVLITLCRAGKTFKATGESKIATSCGIHRIYIQVVSNLDA